MGPDDRSRQGWARLPLRVVAVDDDPMIRLLLRRLFDIDRRFALVATACDGREAIGVVAAHQPDLVVSDVSMPLMDGIDAATQIHLQCPGVKIVMCSGDRGRRDDALRAGAVAWVDKPFHVHELISALLTAATYGSSASQRDPCEAPNGVGGLTAAGATAAVVAADG